MHKSKVIQVVVGKEVFDLAKEMAKAEGRTISNMSKMILLNGLLKKQKMYKKVKSLRLTAKHG